MVLRFIIILITLVLFGCKSDENKEIETVQGFVSTIPKVKKAIVKKAPFFIEIHSMGKLKAVKKADLKFENPGIINRILVNNGDLVTKGQVIAFQESKHILPEIRKNKELLKKAKLNMEDLLLGFGFSLKDSTNIPQHIFEVAKSRSGIEDSKYQLSQTYKKYQDTRIVSPFSGAIANLEISEKSFYSTSDNLCTIIDNSELYVDFYILENELGLVSKGDQIDVIPIALSNVKFNGKIKHINPLVNKNGLVKVKALIKDHENQLIDGMNTNLYLKKKIDNVISIPKTAIVERQGKKVVFTYKDGKSKWNYVETSSQNRDSIIIIKGLNVNDPIIAEGNVNLAHNAEVKLID